MTPPAIDLERLAELAEGGASFSEIAAILGCSRSLVSWHAARIGVVSAHARCVGRDLPPLIVRGGRAVRGFSAEEDALLIEMRLEGRSLCRIGRALGRGHTSVIGRLAALARREDMAEDGNV